ncbi:hypothetical protein HDU93_008816 [Gonapodya sp. JEL0774]|nr:hypothetical protein HDU93_008816 [Gonapodya sp. JEL0774]
MKRERPSESDDTEAEQEELNGGVSFQPRARKYKRTPKGTETSARVSTTAAMERSPLAETVSEEARSALTIPGPQRGWLESLKNRIVALESLIVDRTRAAVSTASAVRHPTLIASSKLPVRTQSAPARSELSETGGSKKEKEKLRTVLHEALSRLEGLFTDIEQPQVEPQPQSVAPVSTPTMDAQLFAQLDYASLAGMHHEQLYEPPNPQFTGPLNQLDLFPTEHANSLALSGADINVLNAVGHDSVPSDHFTIPRSSSLVFRPGSQGLEPGLEWLASPPIFTRPVGLFDDLEPLPPPELVNDLLTQYFRHTWEYRYIYAGQPMMHRPTFMSTVMSQNRLLIYAALAFASAYADADHQTRKQLGRNFFGRCKRLLFQHLEDPAASVGLVQALLIMAQYSNCNERSLAYSLLGICVLKSRELGLHLDPNMTNHGEPPEILSEKWKENEERRRTGWAVYVLDRIAAVTHSRAPILLDHEYCLSPPCSDELWDSSPVVQLRYGSSPGSTPKSPNEEVRNAVPSILQLFMVMGKAQLLKQSQDARRLPTGLIEFDNPLNEWYTNFLAAFPNAADPPFSENFDPQLARGLIVYHTVGVIIHTPLDYLSAPPTWVASQNFRKALYHWLCVKQMVERFQGFLEGVVDVLSLQVTSASFSALLEVLVANIRCGGELNESDLEPIIGELEYYGAWWDIALQLSRELRRQVTLAVESRRIITTRMVRSSQSNAVQQAALRELRDIKITSIAE